MSSTYYAVIIHPSAPTELLSVLRDFLQKEKDGGLNYVFCSSAEVGMHFVQVCLIRKRGDPEPWTIQIPVSYILAIVDVGARPVGPGFLRSE